MKRPAHRRQQILQHRARAEVDLGRDLHARRQRVTRALRQQLLRIEFDDGLVGQRLRAAVAADVVDASNPLPPLRLFSFAATPGGLALV